MTLKKIKSDRKNYKVYFEFYDKHPKRTTTYVTDPATLERIFEQLLHFPEMIEKTVRDIKEGEKVKKESISNGGLR